MTKATSSSSSSRPLVLSCLLEGTDVIVSVLIEGNKDIPSLREVIHAKCEDIVLVSAARLRLVKVDIKYHALTKDSIREIKIGITQEEVQEMLSWQFVSDFWQAQPPERSVHILVQVVNDVPPNPVKRPRSVGDSPELNLPLSESSLAQSPDRPFQKRKQNNCNDVSGQILDKWNIPYPPLLDIAELRIYLNEPLDHDEKVPISKSSWDYLLMNRLEMPAQLCYPRDLELLFKNTEDETAPILGPMLSEAIARGPPDLKGTEDSFHMFWDENIIKILRTALGDPEWIRNSNRGTDTDTGSFKPDIGLFLQMICVFRGEEKESTYYGPHPRQELAEKTRWQYDPAPYVLGYHAVGTVITIVAIQPSGEQIIATDVVSIDLSTRLGRIKNAVRMIKLVKILRTLEDTISKGVDADMFTSILDDGKTIDYYKTKIRKTYRLADRARVVFLRNIYCHLKVKNVPNVDRLTKFKLPESSSPYIELEPRGNNQGPTSAEDVKNAVICILQALTVMHTSSPRIFHRDIRWDNVMRSLQDSQKWFLIDWEDAAIAPTKAAPNLRPTSHSPHVFRDGHGAEVDLWGVGHLICTTTVPGLPQDLISLGLKLKDGTTKSAAEALVLIKT